jgi:hypothetical protein
MIEIYNEQVRDLLNPKGVERNGMPIQQTPTGFKVIGLQPIQVCDFASIEKLKEIGFV